MRAHHPNAVFWRHLRGTQLHHACPHRDAYGAEHRRAEAGVEKHAKVYRLLTWKPIGDTSND